MQTERLERIESRIETYTSNLASAVQSGNGAQFSMLLSMISANQALYKPEFSVPAPAADPDARFQLPAEAQSVYPDPNELYNETVVDRLNHSINDNLPGDFAYINSYIETGARTPRRGRLGADQFEKVALMASGKLMLDEISRSQQQIRTQA
ncbi:hypothetical protein [Marinobacterium jannaschii]|uniref:hypothetical protein n=1 Tax=Marinobacterium jannaschii TaxID=64970 RepID=UPI000488521F|nr:hypothetical protein [Marinobacterium jannaschii]